MLSSVGSSIRLAFFYLSPTSNRFSWFGIYGFLLIFSLFLFLRALVITGTPRVGGGLLHPHSPATEPGDISLVSHI